MITAQSGYLWHIDLCQILIYTIYRARYQIGRRLFCLQGTNYNTFNTFPNVEWARSKANILHAGCRFAFIEYNYLFVLDVLD